MSGGPNFTFFVGDGSLVDRMRWHSAISTIGIRERLPVPPKTVDLVDGLRGRALERTTLFGMEATWACCLRRITVYGVEPRSLDEARDALPSTCPRCVRPIHVHAVELLDLLERSKSLHVVLAHRDGARRPGVVQCFGDACRTRLDVQVSLIRRLEDEGLLRIHRRMLGGRDASPFGRIERLVWSGARWR